MAHVESTLSKQERQRLLDVLGGLDNGATSKSATPEALRCLPGTRETILKQVHHWVLDDENKVGNMMWINGVAGCGKTAIAATVAYQHTDVAIFHFNQSSQERNATVVRSLARSLALLEHRRYEEVILRGAQALQDSSQGYYISAQVEHLLRTPLSSNTTGNRALCIIDAIDEWSDKAGAAELIKLLAGMHMDLPSVKFVVTSRREGHLDLAFKRVALTATTTTIRLDETSPEEMVRDIRTFLSVTLATVQRDQEIEEQWPTPRQLDKLAEMAQGLFQWASTTCKYLGQGDAPSRLKAVLSLKSQGGRLDQLYGLILSQFLASSNEDESPAPGNVTLIQHVLGCLSTAPEPMSLNTLAYLYSPEEDVSRTIFNEVLRHLRALLVVPDDSGHPIRFLHSSIFDYLTDGKRCTDARVYVDRSLHAVRIARRCLSAMDGELIQDHGGVGSELMTGEEERQSGLERIPRALRYVCVRWADYWDFIPHDIAMENLRFLLNSLQEFAEKSLIKWVEAMAYLGPGALEGAVSAARRTDNWLRVSNN